MTSLILSGPLLPDRKNKLFLVTPGNAHLVWLRLWIYCDRTGNKFTVISR